VKFLCIDCDEQMEFIDRQEPGDGTFAAAYSCPTCGRRVAMLANPMETQLVGSLGVKIGGETLDRDPMELVRAQMEGADAKLGARANRPIWTAESRDRLDRVPNFVRGMVMKIYNDWAMERGLTEITPEVMDEARVDLGLEEM
jgi:DNA-directed RNA polymerase subunit RPC12/RpoP